MEQDLFDFAWTVNSGGYEIRRARAFMQSSVPEDMFVTTTLQFAEPHKVRQYFPLHDNTGLFKDFAAIEATEADVIAFANKFGYLGAIQEFVVLEGTEKNTTGERLSVWYKHIDQMKQAVGLWEAARSGKGDALEAIKWVSPDSVRYDHPAGGGAWITAPEIHPELLQWFVPGDPTRPALYYVQRLVNNQLNECVSTRLLWDREHTKQRLYVFPKSLAGALWFQFARAIEGNPEYRRCEECSAFFEVSRKASRMDKRYCGNTCRTVAYRKRQARARELSAQKVPVKKIAAELGTDVETVKKWIGRAR